MPRFSDLLGDDPDRPDDPNRRGGTGGSGAADDATSDLAGADVPVTPTDPPVADDCDHPDEAPRVADIFARLAREQHLESDVASDTPPTAGAAPAQSGDASAPADRLADLPPIDDDLLPRRS